MFQQTLNRDIPRGVAGDFASTNPRQNMLAGEGALVAAEPLTVGQFAFADLATGKVYAAQPADAATHVGFVHRNNQAIVGLGQEASMIIPAGREVALFTSGDFYVVAPDDVVAGDAVYTKTADGAVSADNIDADSTPFIFAENAEAGALVKITRFAI